MRYDKLVILTLLLLMTSCATKWSKAGAGSQEFEATKAACGTRAYSQFPPEPQQTMIMAGYTTPVRTSCYGSGYNYNCYSTGGQYIPPSYMTVDMNQGGREQSIRSCFLERGWTPDR